MACRLIPRHNFSEVHISVSLCRVTNEINDYKTTIIKEKERYLKNVYDFSFAICHLRKRTSASLVLTLTAKTRSRIALEDFVAKFRSVSS